MLRDMVRSSGVSNVRGGAGAGFSSLAAVGEEAGGGGAGDHALQHLDGSVEEAARQVLQLGEEEEDSRSSFQTHQHSHRTALPARRCEKSCTSDN